MFNFKRNTTQAVLMATWLTAGVAMPTYALQSDTLQSVTLEADRAVYNEKTGVTSYEGHVLVEQGTIRIQANKLTAQLTAERRILSVQASGSPVTFEQQLEGIKTISKGQANQLTYDATKNIMTLQGNAVFLHNGASFKGDTLRYSMSKGDIEAVGKGNARVRLVIPPNLTQKPQGAKSRS